MWIDYSEMVVPKGPIHPLKWEFMYGVEGVIWDSDMNCP